MAFSRNFRNDLTNLKNKFSSQPPSHQIYFNENSTDFVWKLAITCSGSNPAYINLQYEIQIEYHRNPEQRPIITLIPQKYNPRPIFLPIRRQRIVFDLVEESIWTPATKAEAIIDKLLQFFSPSTNPTAYIDRIDLLDQALLDQLLQFLSVYDILQLSLTSKSLLARIKNDNTWSVLFYKTYLLPYNVLYISLPSIPLRVYVDKFTCTRTLRRPQESEKLPQCQLGSISWVWADTYEAFVNAYESKYYNDQNYLDLQHNLLIELIALAAFINCPYTTMNALFFMDTNDGGSLEVEYLIRRFQRSASVLCHLSSHSKVYTSLKLIALKLALNKHTSTSVPLNLRPELNRILSILYGELGYEPVLPPITELFLFALFNRLVAHKVVRHIGGNNRQFVTFMADRLFVFGQCIRWLGQETVASFQAPTNCSEQTGQQDHYQHVPTPPYSLSQLMNQIITESTRRMSPIDSTNDYTFHFDEQISTTHHIESVSPLEPQRRSVHPIHYFNDKSNQVLRRFARPSLINQQPFGPTGGFRQVGQPQAQANDAGNINENGPHDDFQPLNEELFNQQVPLQNQQYQKTIIPDEYAIASFLGHELLQTDIPVHTCLRLDFGNINATYSCASPDVYDLLEYVYEMHRVASEAHTNSDQSSILDVNDQQQEWAAAVIDKLPFNINSISNTELPNRNNVFNKTYSNMFRSSLRRHAAFSHRSEMRLADAYIAQESDSLKFAAFRKFYSSERERSGELANLPFGVNGLKLPWLGPSSHVRYIDVDETDDQNVALDGQYAQLIHITTNCISQELKNNLLFPPGFLSEYPYDNCNMGVPDLTTRNMHFLGYAPRFDENHVLASVKVAPIRTRSQRALTVAIEETNEIINNSIPKLCESFDYASWKLSVKEKYVEIRVRCLWLIGSPGSGLVRMKAPLWMEFKTIQTEYCHIFKEYLSIAGLKVVSIGIINMVEASQYSLDRRFRVNDCPKCSETLPGIQIMKLGSKLDDVGVQNGDVLDVFCK